jgi:hypothetical protein
MLMPLTRAEYLSSACKVLRLSFLDSRFFKIVDHIQIRHALDNNIRVRLEFVAKKWTGKK